jgi:pimeloyl-ACP methyl ester carboxylesterase
MFTKNSTGSDLYYEIDGDGDAVVLCPGAASSSVNFTESGFSSLLAEQFKVVLYDYTGMGKSGRVNEVSPSQWCEDIVSVLDAAGIEKAHLAGVSLGSRIAARVALDHPERVLTLTVDAPITHVDTAGDAALTAQFENPDASPRADSWARMHGEDWRDVIRFYGRARADQALQSHLTLRPHLAEIKAPTLITRGDHDDAVHPLVQALEWHAGAVDSWLWLAPGSATSSTISEFPRQFIETFTAFVTAKKG